LFTQRKKEKKDSQKRISLSNTTTYYFKREKGEKGKGCFLFRIRGGGKSIRKGKTLLFSSRGERGGKKRTILFSSILKGEKKREKPSHKKREGTSARICSERGGEKKKGIVPRLSSPGGGGDNDYKKRGRGKGNFHPLL